MTDKFPGSWWKVLVLCLAIVGAKVIRVSLLQPTLASWVPDPAAVRLELSGLEGMGRNIVTNSTVEALAIVAQYEDEFTPELEERVRALAELRGMNSARLPTVRSMFLVMAGDDLLLEPRALEANPPPDYEVVCGDGPPSYVCLMLTLHINSVAQGYAESQQERQQRQPLEGQGGAGPR